MTPDKLTSASSSEETSNQDSVKAESTSATGTPLHQAGTATKENPIYEGGTASTGSTSAEGTTNDTLSE